VTRRHVIAIVLAPLLLLATHSRGVAAGLNGTWAITPAAESGKFYLDLTIEDLDGHGHSRGGENYTPASIGLAPAQLAGSGHRIAFTIARDAGSFACEGWIDNGRGGGSATFTPSAGFISSMNLRGYDLSLNQLASAATVDLTVPFIDGVVASGIPKPSFEELISMRALGIDAAYIAALRSVGITAGSARELIELKALKVDANYVKTLAAVGYSNLSPRQLVQLRALKIDADFVRRVKAHGLSHPSVEDLIRLKSMDVI